MNADALFVRGMCLYYQDSIEKAFQHFQQVLKLVPDHHKSKEVYKVSNPFIGKHFDSTRADFNFSVDWSLFRTCTKHLIVWGEWHIHAEC